MPELGPDNVNMVSCFQKLFWIFLTSVYIFSLSALRIFLHFYLKESLSHFSLERLDCRHQYYCTLGTFKVKQTLLEHKILWYNISCDNGGQGPTQWQQAGNIYSVHTLDVGTVHTTSVVGASKSNEDMMTTRHGWEEGYCGYEGE